jgi:serine/threonine protein kinase/beta-lactam-binding protein with PASTA domain
MHPRHMRDDSLAPGAPRLGPYEDTPRLAVEALYGDGVPTDAGNRTVSFTANTATFPTVFGAGMTTTSIGDPLVGHLLDGRYQITERLARGGMATVYRAIDSRLTRTVAVKIMHVGLGDDAEFARKFDREARAAARLSHPCVVSVFDQGRDRTENHGGRPYIVMEYVEGQTLRDVLNREAPVEPVRCLDMMEPVLAALAAAHDAGLVHRDVKPENVLISDRGQIKVADFGLAKAVSSQTSTATQGLLIGTVSYLPPELVVSGKADARSDVYSAGVVLFELLTGRKPHTGDTPIQVAYAHVHADVPAPSSLAPPGRIPPYLDALIARATARDPEARPPDARVFLAELRRVRSALQEGLADDPELSQELRPAREAAPVPRKLDRSDYEATQMVSTPVTVGPTTGPRHYASPTVVDAPPPPVPRPVYPLTPERMVAQRERQARKRRRGWLALLLVLLLTTGAALAGWYVTTGRFTTAPALQMLSRSEATTVAHRAGLTITFVDGYSESVGRGLVISTDPAAGDKMVDGGQIRAVLSQGPERYPMPTVIGLSRAAATEALNHAHLVIGKTSQSYSDTVTSGLVISASESAGTKLRQNTPVDLVISKGPRPIKIANYEGKPAKDAATALKKAGFEVTMTAKHSGAVPAGSVISQTPNSGTGAPGEEIKLVRSLGPVLVTVPNVRSMGVRAAQKVMKDAGFDTKVQPVSINYIGVGFVVFTNPRAGGQAPKGSTVTLYVV